MMRAWKDEKVLKLTLGSSLGLLVASSAARGQELTPRPTGRRPASRSACLIHLRSVSAVQPIF